MSRNKHGSKKQQNSQKKVNSANDNVYKSMAAWHDSDSNTDRIQIIIKKQKLLRWLHNIECCQFAILNCSDETMILQTEAILNAESSAITTKRF